MKIEKVVIVGGGSSGWMTAAALSKVFSTLDITLIESKNIGTIGVGESTLSYINDFFTVLGIKDEEWMPFCDATYKNSIQFTDFSVKGETFQYPFGKWMTNQQKPLMQWFAVKAAKPELPNNTFAKYYTICGHLAEQNRICIDETPDYAFSRDVAYHLDAAKLGEYLKDKMAIPNGVTHIVDDVTDIITDDNGIKCIKTAEGRELTADLFIDCTGFKSLLLEQTMGVEFNDFCGELMNDSAIAARIPYIDKQKEMISVTDCTAIENGWVWTIPLWSRIGTGYVYSSKFATPEQAEEQFRNFLAKTDKARAEAAEFKHIKIRHGMHKKAWVKNVAAVGLSYGFIEPLESTGLLTTHENIMALISALERRNGNVSKIEIDAFNIRIEQLVRGLKEFVSLHYAMSSRDDTPYWKHVTEHVTYDDKLAENWIRYNPVARNFMMKLGAEKYYDEPMSGVVFIAAGMGYNPLTPTDIKVRKFPTDALAAAYDGIKKEIATTAYNVSLNPTHYEYLSKNIHKC